MAIPKFTRLVRFSNAQGTIFYGELGNDVVAAEDLAGRTVPVFAGSAPWDDDFKLTEKNEKIAQVHSRLRQEKMKSGA
jgi:hypothetical protein